MLQFSPMSFENLEGGGREEMGISHTSPMCSVLPHRADIDRPPQTLQAAPSETRLNPS